MKLPVLSPALRQKAAPLLARWESLPVRDRRALALLAAFGFCLLAWFAVVAPVRDYAAGARERLASANADLAWMQANAAAARDIPSGPGTAPAGASLLSLVNATAREAGLELQRFEPEGEGRVRVSLENAAFTDVMRWLVILQQRYGLAVTQFTADATGEGRANIKLAVGH